MLPETREDMETEKVKKRELLLKKALLYNDCLGNELGEAYSLRKQLERLPDLHIRPRVYIS